MGTRRPNDFLNRNHIRKHENRFDLHHLNPDFEEEHKRHHTPSVQPLSCTPLSWKKMWSPSSAQAATFLACGFFHFGGALHLG